MAKNKTTDPQKTKKNSRGKDTRQMILNAAQKVFAMHPYNAASIRMIASKGEFYHGLIRYHFPSKAAIFEEVIKNSCMTLYDSNNRWLNEVAALPAKEGLSIYMDRFIEFSRNNPEICRIIIQNLSHDDPSTLPGYQHLKNLFSNNRKDFKKIVNVRIPDADINKFADSFNALIFRYLGTKHIAAHIAGFDPESDEYLKWVKDTLLFVFLPVLNQYRE